MTTPYTNPIPPFDKILNFRDVGATIDTFSQPHGSSSPSQHSLKPSQLFRSARPDAATHADVRRLTTVHNIRTIVDLRTPGEATEYRQKLATAAAADPANAVPSNDSAAEPPPLPGQIPGIVYENINLTSSTHTRGLLAKLPYLSLAKLAWNYALGYRSAAISILGTQVLGPRGLTQLTLDNLVDSKAEIAAVFQVLGSRGSWPVLVHCSQGKDRTGVVVLLTLLLCGVPEGVVERDYLLSADELLPEREERLRELGEMGLPEEFAGCPKDLVRVVAKWLREEYGGAEGYLRSCGVQQTELDIVMELLGGSHQGQVLQAGSGWQRQGGSEIS